MRIRVPVIYLLPILVAYAAAPVQAQGTNWNGFYIGAGVGASWLDGDIDIKNTTDYGSRTQCELRGTLPATTRYYTR